MPCRSRTPSADAMNASGSKHIMLCVLQCAVLQCAACLAAAPALLHSSHHVPAHAHGPQLKLSGWIAVGAWWTACKRRDLACPAPRGRLLVAWCGSQGGLLRPDVATVGRASRWAYLGSLSGWPLAYRGRRGLCSLYVGAALHQRAQHVQQCYCCLSACTPVR